MPWPRPTHDFAAKEAELKRTAVARGATIAQLTAEYSPWTLRHMLRAVLCNDTGRLCEEQVSTLSALAIARAIRGWAIDGAPATRGALLSPDDEAEIAANSAAGTAHLLATNTKSKYSVRGTDGKLRMKSRQVRRHIVLRRRANGIVQRAANATTIE